MRTGVIWPVVLLGMAGTAFSENPQHRPKELTVDLGGGVKLEMVLIPAGEFMMGSPDSDKNAVEWEKPQHRVRITKPFYLGKYPVTQGQYQRLMGMNPSWFCKSGDGKGKIGQQDTSHFPVETVPWDDAVEFCARLSEKEKKEYRLPTEAQREFACRAGSTTRWCFGDDAGRLGEYAWFVGNSGGRAMRWARRSPMSGASTTCTATCGNGVRIGFGEDYYANSPADDPSGPETGSGHVLRGGRWFNPAWYCRSADRDYFGPGKRLDLGFRVSQTPVEK